MGIAHLTDLSLLHPCNDTSPEYWHLSTDTWVLTPILTLEYWHVSSDISILTPQHWHPCSDTWVLTDTLYWHLNTDIPVLTPEYWLTPCTDTWVLTPEYWHPCTDTSILTPDYWHPWYDTLVLTPVVIINPYQCHYCSMLKHTQVSLLHAIKKIYFCIQFVLNVVLELFLWLNLHTN